MNTLLNRFSLTQKFAALGIMVVALFGIPTYLFVSGLNESIDFASRESTGAAYFKPVMPPQQNLGSPRAKRQDVDKAAAAIDEMDKRYPELGVTAKWQKVKSAWQAVKNDVAGLTPPESFKRHGAVIDLELELITAVSDQSNITYDPTVDGYQLGFLATSRLPTITAFYDDLIDFFCFRRPCAGVRKNHNGKT